MTRPAHAHRQAQSPGVVALTLGALAALALLLMVAGPREPSLAEGDALTRLIAARDAARAAPPASSPAPTIAPAAAVPDDQAVMDTMGGSVATGRPEVAVPSAELRASIGPGRGATAVFLGDSYTSGWKGAGIGSRGWPRIVGSARGWETVNLAIPGTGFLNPGWTDQRIGTLVSKAAKARPDVVVLAGGHNDSRWSAAATARAADDAIDGLRAALPDALLVIVGPIWQDGSPPQRCLALRDRLRARAGDLGAIFIDPLAGGWFGGSSHRLIGGDGIHPTDAGHQFIADQVLAALGG